MRWRTAHNRRKAAEGRRYVEVSIYGPSGDKVGVLLGRKTIRVGRRWKAYQFGFTRPLTPTPFKIEDVVIHARATRKGGTVYTRPLA